MMTVQVSKNKQKQKIMPPKKYGVFLLNDDYTTMDFVVMILMDIFGMSAKKAHQIMMQVHEQGKGLCGIYSRDIAQTKQQQVLSLAVEAGFPLVCIVEEM